MRDIMDTIRQPKLWTQGTEFKASIRSSTASVKQSKIWPRAGGPNSTY